MQSKNSFSSSDASSAGSMGSFAEVSVAIPPSTHHASNEDETTEQLYDHEADIYCIKGKEDMKALLQAVLHVDDSTFFANATGEDVVKGIHRLMRGSKQLGMPDLHTKAVCFATNAIEAKIGHSVAVLKAFESHPNLGLETEKLALETIVANPKMLSTSEELFFVTDVMMEKLLKEKKTHAKDFVWLQILQSWSEFERNFVSKASHFVAKYLSLQSIDARHLVAFETSLIVTKDQLYEVFKARAIMLDVEKGPSHMEKAPSSDSFQKWKFSNSDVAHNSSTTWKSEILDCDWLRPGDVHKWSVQLGEQNKSVFNLVGVVANMQNFDYDHSLYDQEGTWVLAGAFKCDHESCDTIVDSSLKFGKGSKVTLVLDLTDSGTLSASVDGGTTFELFSGMIRQASLMGASPGFLPAVSLSCASCKVRFLGFE